MKRLLIITSIVVTLIIIFCLNFHVAYVSGIYGEKEYKVFPKESWTFKYTYLDDEDVRELIQKFNKTPFLYKVQMADEPIYKALIGQGLIMYRNK